LLKETLRLDRAKLGPEHPQTLAALKNLAEMYARTGHFVPALPLYEEVFRLQKTRLGPAHAQTLLAMNTLAVHCHRMGKLDRSSSLLEEVVKLRKATSGLEHSDTWVALFNLGNTYQDANRLPEAIAAFEAVYHRARQRPAPPTYFTRLAAALVRAY